MLTFTTRHYKDVVIAHLYLRNARVVVARARALGLGPVVDVHVLDLRPAQGERGRDEHVVELLRVLVVEVRVALRGGHARERVGLEQEPVERREDGARLAVLVAVARDDHRRVGIEREEGGDEVL